MIENVCPPALILSFLLHFNTKFLKNNSDFVLYYSKMEYENNIEMLGDYSLQLKVNE